MKRNPQALEVDVSALDLGHLALFVGMRVNDVVLEQLHAAGFADVRTSHGFVFQHLLGGPCSVGVLASRLGVTQQAASKSVAELERLGLVHDVRTTEDARVRNVALTRRALECVERSRRIRGQAHKAMEKRHGRKEVARTRELLRAILEDLGGLDAVTQRRVRNPR